MIWPFARKEEKASVVCICQVHPLTGSIQLVVILLLLQFCDSASKVDFSAMKSIVIITGAIEQLGKSVCIRVYKEFQPTFIAHSIVFKCERSLSIIRIRGDQQIGHSNGFEYFSKEEPEVKVCHDSHRLTSPIRYYTLIQSPSIRRHFEQFAITVTMKRFVMHLAVSAPTISSSMRNKLHMHSVGYYSYVCLLSSIFSFQSMLYRKTYLQAVMW